MNAKNPLDTAIEAKKALRSQAIARRSNQVVDSASVCRSLELFLGSKLAPGTGYVVVYDALDGEVSLSRLWEPRDEAGSLFRYAITRTPQTGMDLSVHPVTVDLERHRWGYRQPVAGSPEVDLAEIAAVLVPALAFDMQGGRLGWGAGYYDRLLSRVRPSALRIGISDGFIVPAVPTQAHDVPMTHIATPSGVITV